MRFLARMSSTDALSHPSIGLNDGGRIPLLGFGVFQMPDAGQCRSAVLVALEAGYRHLDTALVYGNEASVGAAMRESGLGRGEIFLTTKTPLQSDPARMKPGLEGSLERLQTDYVDLYLIHWPMADDGLVECWQALEELRAAGKCRSIGVSNFSVKRFEKAFFPRANVVPAVNQIEMHVFNQQHELVEYCRSREIAVEAYSPLCRGSRMEHPVIARIAKAHGKSNAQIMLRFLIQRGIVTLVKSSTPTRIRENAAVFDFQLSPGQVTELEQLEEGCVIQDWFPPGFY